MMKTIKKLCIFAGLAGVTGCYTGVVRTTPVMAPAVVPTVVAPTTSTIIYDTAPVYMSPAWGFGPRWHHGWGFGPRPHAPHFPGRHR